MANGKVCNVGYVFAGKTCVVGRRLAKTFCGAMQLRVCAVNLGVPSLFACTNFGQVGHLVNPKSVNRLYSLGIEVISKLGCWKI